MMDKFDQIKAHYETSNPGKRFNLNNFEMLKVFNGIFTKTSKGELTCTEGFDGYVHIISTKKLLDDHYPKLRKIRSASSANYLQLRKYRDMGFLEIQNKDGKNWFKPTPTFLKFFK